MSLKIYLFLMSLGTLLCWVAWIFVITSLAPQESGIMGLVIFYSSLFLALVGSISVLGFLIRRAKYKNDELVFRHVRHTFRQSILIGAFAICLLILRANNVLTWWTLVLLLIFFFVLEGIVFTSRKFNNVEYV